MVARALRWGTPVAATALAAAVVAAARDGGRPADSGIRGHVVPCGIVHERASCARDVRAAVVRVRRASDGRVLATARPDRKGRFRVALRAGRYTVETARASRSARGARPVGVAVTVRAHAWTTLTLPSGPLSPPRGRSLAS